MAGLLFAITASSEFFWEKRTDSILGGCFGGEWIQDPSGYVYEAVTTNRVAGVTATALWIPEPEDAADEVLNQFYTNKPDDENFGQKWEAKEYGQCNPLTTVSDGSYAWDVPCGWWRVRYEKDGYETTYSNWLPVPPPQLEVKVPIVSCEAPVLESVEAETRCVKVTFSKYMQPETVKTALTLNGQTVDVSWPTHETAADGTVYARTFTLTPAAPLAEKSAVTVSVTADAKSYAGTAASAHTLTAEVGSTPKLIVPETFEVACGDTVRLPIETENVDQTQIVVTSRMNAIVSVCGSALTGNLPGTAAVTVSVEGTTLSETVTVRVLQQETADPALEPEIGDIQKVESTMRVPLTNCPTGYLIAAGYTADKMVWVNVIPVSSGTALVEVSDVPQAERYQVFLLDTYHAPVCSFAEP